MTAPFQGTPPGLHAGDTSRRTVALRPDVGLTDEQVDRARALRKQGNDPEAIAFTLGAPLEAVERALLAMRTPKPDRTRRTLNVTREAGALVHRERQEDEPVWQTVDRLLAELIERRGA